MFILLDKRFQSGKNKTEAFSYDRKNSYNYNYSFISENNVIIFFVL